MIRLEGTEATVSQFIRFLNENEKGNWKEGGVKWYVPDENPRWNVIESDDGKRFGYKDFKKNGEEEEWPVQNVSWFGAARYCEWAGKQLPSRKEWLAAAQGKSTWKKRFEKRNYYWKVGHSNAKSRADVSRIGCFDMGSNVAEWCVEYKDVKRGERYVCGSSF